MSHRTKLVTVSILVMFVASSIVAAVSIIALYDATSGREDSP